MIADNTGDGCAVAPDCSEHKPPRFRSKNLLCPNVPTADVKQPGFTTGTRRVIAAEPAKQDSHPLSSWNKRKDQVASPGVSSLITERRFGHEEEVPEPVICDHRCCCSVRRDGFRAAVAERLSGINLRRHMQPHPALSYLQLRLFFHHTDHRILYDEAGRGRAFTQIAMA
jgi:hypothetical protein